MCGGGWSVEKNNYNKTQCTHTSSNKEQCLNRSRKNLRSLVWSETSILRVSVVISEGGLCWSSVILSVFPHLWNIWAFKEKNIWVFVALFFSLSFYFFSLGKLLSFFCVSIYILNCTFSWQLVHTKHQFTSSLLSKDTLTMEKVRKDLLRQPADHSRTSPKRLPWLTNSKIFCFSVAPKSAGGKQ